MVVHFCSYCLLGLQCHDLEIWRTDGRTVPLLAADHVT
jgi:hypothetical protein